MFQSSRVNNEASSTDITKDYNSQSSVMKLENKHVLAKLVMEKDLSFFFFCESKHVLGNINPAKTEGI